MVICWTGTAATTKYSHASPHLRHGSREDLEESVGYYIEEIGSGWLQGLKTCRNKGDDEIDLPREGLQSHSVVQNLFYFVKAFAKRSD